MMADALQALENTTIEYKDAMKNFTSIILTLSQSLTQTQEAILALSKKLHTPQAQTNNKKPATDKKKRSNKSKNYCWTYGRTRNENHTSPTCNQTKEGHHVGDILENRMGGSGK